MCGRCGKKWSGYRAAHCATCHETFGGLILFDIHRPGQCRTPAELGLVQRNGIWRQPMPPEVIQRLKDGPK